MLEEHSHWEDGSYLLTYLLTFRTLTKGFDEAKEKDANNHFFIKCFFYV